MQTNRIMKESLVKDNWKIIEDEFQSDSNKESERIFSIGNGQMGQRANFEETFTGNTLQGNYISGVYHPEKKLLEPSENSTPFADLLNACDWIGIRIILDQEEVNLHQCEINSFYRELDMKCGLLTRKVEFTTAKGRHLSLDSRRFCSMADDEIGAIQYRVQSHNYKGGLALVSHLDFDVKEHDSDPNEKYWNEDLQAANDTEMYVTAQSSKTDILCAASMDHKLTINSENDNHYFDFGKGEKYVEVFVSGMIAPKGAWIYEKYVNLSSTLNHTNEDLLNHAKIKSKAAKDQGFDLLLAESTEAWKQVWSLTDEVPNDDIVAQQEQNFNIYQEQLRLKK